MPYYTHHNIWTLTTMHVSVCYQTGLITVCLVKNIRAPTTRHALTCYQSALITENLITHKYKGCHHYEIVDVLSDGSVD